MGRLGRQWLQRRKRRVFFDEPGGSNSLWPDRSGLLPAPVRGKLNLSQEMVVANVPESEIHKRRERQGRKWSARGPNWGAAGSGPKAGPAAL